MLAAVLACIETEATYIPLDPDYPAARLQFMLQDSGAGLLITDVPALFDGYQGGVVTTDARVQTLSLRSGNLPVAPLTADLPLAYLIYTSGSTGQPKGVRVPTTAVQNFLLSMQSQPGLSAGDRLLAVTTLSFDIAVLELLLPLLSGAELILASAETAKDGRSLAELMDRTRPTVMQAIFRCFISIS